MRDFAKELGKRKSASFFSEKNELWTQTLKLSP